MLHFFATFAPHFCRGIKFRLGGDFFGVNTEQKSCSISMRRKSKFSCGQECESRKEKLSFILDKRKGGKKEKVQA